MKNSLACVFIIIAIALTGCDDTGFTIDIIKPFSTALGSGFNDEANSVKQTPDEGFIITGRTLLNASASSSEGFMVKLTKDRALQWSQTYGGSQNETFNSISTTSDGGYIGAGFTESFGSGGQDFYILKTNSNGTMEWSFAYGGSETESASSIKRAADGGFIAVGYTTTFGAGNSDVWAVKISSSGAVEWSKAYGGTGNDAAFDVFATTDGGYIIAGETASFGVPNQDCFIIKINSTGDVEWSKTYGSPSTDGLSCVQPAADGGYILSGSTNLAGSYDVLMIKINAAGNIEWNRTYGGSSQERNASIYPVAGGYIGGGYTQSFGSGGSDLYMIKILTDGSLEWSKAYGGTGADVSGAFIPVSDGGFLGTGRTGSYGAGANDIYIIKTDESGNSCVSGINAGTIVSTAPLTELNPLTVTSSTGSIPSGAGTLQNNFSIVENIICR